MITETLKYAEGVRKAGNQSPALTEDADTLFAFGDQEVLKKSDSYIKPRSICSNKYTRASL